MPYYFKADTAKTVPLFRHFQETVCNGSSDKAADVLQCGLRTWYRWTSENDGGNPGFAMVVMAHILVTEQLPESFKPNWGVDDLAKLADIYGSPEA